MPATPTNHNRAKRCDNVLRRYGTDNTQKGCLIDLLADARHWCDLNSESFGELDRIAYEHYLAELDEQRRSQ
jgi:hypothetical protein